MTCFVCDRVMKYERESGHLFPGVAIKDAIALSFIEGIRYALIQFNRTESAPPGQMILTTVEACPLHEEFFVKLWNDAGLTAIPFGKAIRTEEPT